MPESNSGVVTKVQDKGLEILKRYSQETERTLNTASAMIKDFDPTTSGGSTESTARQMLASVKTWSASDSDGIMDGRPEPAKTENRSGYDRDGILAYQSTTTSGTWPQDQATYCDLASQDVSNLISMGYNDSAQGVMAIVQPKCPGILNRIVNASPAQVPSSNFVSELEKR